MLTHTGERFHILLRWVRYIKLVVEELVRNFGKPRNRTPIEQRFPNSSCALRELGGFNVKDLGD